MDIEKERRSDLLESGALGGTQTVGGLELRPMTAASWSIYQRLRAAAGDGDGDDLMLSLFSFVYIHSQPTARLKEFYSRPDLLVGEVFDFMASNDAGAGAVWRPWWEEQMEQFSASITAAGATDGGQDPKA